MGAAPAPCAHHRVSQCEERAGGGETNPRRARRQSRQLRRVGNLFEHRQHGQAPGSVRGLAQADAGVAARAEELHAAAGRAERDFLAPRRPGLRCEGPPDDPAAPPRLPRKGRPLDGICARYAARGQSLLRRPARGDEGAGERRDRVQDRAHECQAGRRQEIRGRREGRGRRESGFGQGAEGSRRRTRRDHCAARGGHPRLPEISHAHHDVGPGARCRLDDVQAILRSPIPRIPRRANSARCSRRCGSRISRRRRSRSTFPRATPATGTRPRRSATRSCRRCWRPAARSASKRARTSSPR